LHSEKLLRDCAARSKVRRKLEGEEKIIIKEAKKKLKGNKEDKHN
jgi:hypothetical protein